mgnify:CR=1 FL=1
MVSLMSIQKNEILVKDVMLRVGLFPVLNEDDLVKETLESMNQYKLGVACIINKNRKLLGVLTDGDIRRLLFKMQKPLSAIFVDDVMDYATKSFINVKPNLSLKKALLQMEQKRIWDIPVLNDDGNLEGLLHLHPAIQYVLNN